MLTYSLGFAHNIIPHQHDSETDTHAHAHSDKHNHHHETTNEDSDHQHISHGDHFDEGLYDLLVCFLHETDFHTDDCNTHYMIPTKINRSLSKDSKQLLIMAILQSVFIETEESTSITNVKFEKTLAYLSPYIEDSPLRGPPTFL